MHLPHTCSLRRLRELPNAAFASRSGRNAILVENESRALLSRRAQSWTYYKLRLMDALGS